MSLRGHRVSEQEKPSEARQPSQEDGPPTGGIAGGQGAPWWKGEKVSVVAWWPPESPLLSIKFIWALPSSPIYREPHLLPGALLPPAVFVFPGH